MESILIIIFAISFSSADEYCLSESFSPECQQDELIVVERGQFGRMRFGRCIKETQGISLVAYEKYLGCSVDVTEGLNKKCFGKNACEVKILNPNWIKESSCYEELTMYLDASYKCLKVVQDNRQCMTKLTSESILHIFHPVSKTSCGTKDNPWRVETYKGQRINVSILNVKVSVSTYSTTVCDANNAKVYVVDTNDKRKIPTCRGDGNQENDYKFTSSSNSIEIYFNSGFSDDKVVGKSILVITATGCSDLIPPADAWLKRTEDEAIIGCYSTRLRWQLKCIGHQWMGVIGNCSFAPVNIEDSKSVSSDFSAEKESQVVLVATICAVGIILCVIISCFGVVCFRRYSSKSKLATKLFYQHQSSLHLQKESRNYGQFSNGVTDVMKPRPAMYADCGVEEMRKYSQDATDNQYFVLDSDPEKPEINNI